MLLKKTLCGSALGLILLSATPAYSEALDDNKVVKDRGGNIVRSTAFGNCVRTKWEADSNACAPLMEEAKAEPVRTELSTADKTVFFEFDSAKLTPQAQERLNEVAMKLKSAEDIQSARIVGYADRKGDAAYNRKLSRDRAESVKAYLAQQGYLNTQVAKVRGLGETTAFTSCDPALPRAKEIECLRPDRRVELEVEYQKTPRYSQAN